MIDKRGQRGGGAGMGSLLGLLPLVTRFRGGWIVVLIVVGLMLVGGVGGLGGMFGGSSETTTTGAPVAGHRTDDKKAQFVAFVLDDTQAFWRKELAAHGETYRNAKLVMFANTTPTACGGGQAATGPFYCPADERAYIDLSFYQELESKLGAKGDFAQAYVLAHEVGHHLQKQMGISDKVHSARGSQQKGAEGAGVKLELQADCFAGMWAKSAKDRDILDPGDIDEAMTATAAIGDDRLQKMSGRAVNPEKWTHGSSAERSRWFKIGYEQGTLEACDTFSGARR